MPSSIHNNGTITLKSLSELASVLDVENLPPGPPEAAPAIDGRTDDTLEDARADPHSLSAAEPPSNGPQLDLSSVIAHLARVSSDLERARRTAAILAPGVRHVTEPALREFDVGAWSGLTRAHKAGKQLAVRRVQGRHENSGSPAHGVDIPVGDHPIAGDQRRGR